MSVGTWSPNPNPEDQAASIDRAFLMRCIEIMSVKPGEPDQSELILADSLTEQQKVDQAPLMRLEAEAWNTAAADISADDIYALMRFFTLAEMQINGWEAEDKSPVIWLNKLLKRRGEPLNREQVMWIKGNTRNRFLPNGAIL